MSKLVVIAMVSVMGLSAAASPRSPARRLGAIDARVMAVVFRVRTLPSDAAGTEALAADLERVAAEAKAAMTPDLRVTALYDSLAQDVAKIPALAEAVRASWPCRDGIRKIAEANARDRIAMADEIARVETACKAFETAARMTKLQSAAAAATRELRGARNGVGAAVSRQQQRAARQEADARRAAEQAQTVMGRFPDLTADDSYDPAKIAQAFERVPADLVYTAGTEARLELDPFATLDLGSCRSSESKKFEVTWYHNGEASSLEVRGGNVGLTTGVPLLIWQRRGKDAVVVSLEGLRFKTTDVETLVAGVPARASWPKTAHLLCLDDGMVEALVNAKLLDASVVSKADKARDAVGACVSRTWKSGEREFQANDTANITAPTRDNRYSALLDKYTNKVERACTGQRRGYEAAMLGLMTSLAKPRIEALATATAALAAK